MCQDNLYPSVLQTATVTSSFVCQDNLYPSVLQTATVTPPLCVRTACIHQSCRPLLSLLLCVSGQSVSVGPADRYCHFSFVCEDNLYPSVLQTATVTPPLCVRTACIRQSCRPLCHFSFACQDNQSVSIADYCCHFSFACQDNLYPSVLQTTAGTFP